MARRYLGCKAAHEQVAGRRRRAATGTHLGFSLEPTQMASQISAYLRRWKQLLAERGVYHFRSAFRTGEKSTARCIGRTDRRSAEQGAQRAGRFPYRADCRRKRLKTRLWERKWLDRIRHATPQSASQRIDGHRRPRKSGSKPACGLQRTNHQGDTTTRTGDGSYIPTRWDAHRSSGLYADGDSYTI